MGSCLTLCFKKENSAESENSDDSTTRLIRVEEDLDYNNDNCSGELDESDDYNQSSCTCYSCKNKTMYCYKRGNHFCVNRFETI